MIKTSELTHIARLARLDLSEVEAAALASQMDSILEYVNQLDAADTAAVDPTCFVIPPHDPLRADEEAPSLDADLLLSNGPLVKKGHFAVPKVIGGP